MPKVIGKYQIIQTIGDGLTCKVKLAFDQESKEKVAIKIIKPDLD
jgi:serine/threonine protein kinase